MVDKSDALLEARVIARNRAGEVANELYPQLLKIFKSYSGKKVLKSDGRLLKKILDQLERITWPRRLIRTPTKVVFTEEYWRELSINKILFKVNVCAVNVLAYNELSEVCNEEVSVYICGLSNGVIGEWSEDKLSLESHWGGTPDFRTDYNFNEVKSLREEWRVAKQKADDAEKACWPFGVQ